MSRPMWGETYILDSGAMSAETAASKQAWEKDQHLQSCRDEVDMVL